MTVERLLPDVARDDLDACARLHREEIRDGFLSTLGPRFLMRLYASLAAGPSSFVLVERGEYGQIRGLICGSERTARVYREFMRHAGIATLAALALRLMRPRRLLRACETLLYPSRTESDELPDAEILNFCVSGASQGQGVGQRLFAALVGEFQTRGIASIRIVTGVEQHSAHRFYEAAGAKRVGQTAVHAGSAELVFLFRSRKAVDVSVR